MSRPKEGDKKWKDDEIWVYKIINAHDKGWQPASEIELYEQIKELKEVCYDYKRQVIQDSEQIKELKNYAEHKHTCPKCTYKTGLRESNPNCNCGLDKLLNKH